MESVSGPHAGQSLVTAGAPAAAAEVALVALHGRGATAQGVVNLFEPAVGHGVAVFAPEAARSRWFPRAFDDPVEANEPHLSSAVECVAAALSRAAAIGLPPERVVLVGFSQGACLAAEFARRNPARYGGVVVLSGALPGPPDRDGDGDVENATVAGTDHDHTLDGTPVFLGCGTEDPHVGPEQVDSTAATFEALGASVTTRLYPGLGHAVTDDEFDVLRTLLDGATAAAGSE
jgi:phospholipase/carboxylesterase